MQLKWIITNNICQIWALVIHKTRDVTNEHLKLWSSKICKKHFIWWIMRRCGWNIQLWWLFFFLLITLDYLYLASKRSLRRLLVSWHPFKDLGNLHVLQNFSLIWDVNLPPSVLGMSFIKEGKIHNFHNLLWICVLHNLTWKGTSLL